MRGVDQASNPLQRIGAIAALAAAAAGCGAKVISFSEMPDAAADGPISLDAQSFDAAIDVPVEAPMPPDLPMTCEGATPSLTFELPCMIGQAPIYATECRLSDALDAGIPGINLLTNLNEISQRLNQPLNVADYLAAAPAQVTFGGKRFTLKSIDGTVIFYEVDTVKRSFAGRLESVRVSWTTDVGETLTCTTTDAPFWAVPGNFL
jgi:hypothetical protein